MTHSDITQMMCRASMWRGFAEKIEKDEQQAEEDERINREDEIAEEKRLWK